MRISRTCRCSRRVWQARDNDPLRRILCEHVPETFAWLLSLGVRFYGPMPEPPHRVPRMHNVLPNSRSYIWHLERHARRIGVAIRCGTRARRLIQDGGRVIGVETGNAERILAAPRRRARGRRLHQRRRAQAPLHLRAGRQGRRRQSRPRPATARPWRSSSARASSTAIWRSAPRSASSRRSATAWCGGCRPGLLLGSFMAWSLDHMPPALLRPFVMSFVTTALAPSPALFEAGAVLINRQGERFCDELDEPALALPDQPDGQAYILLDQTIAEKFSAWPNFISTAPGVAYAYLADYRRNRKDVFNSRADAGGPRRADRRAGGCARAGGPPARTRPAATGRPRLTRPGAVLCARAGAQRVRAQRGRARGRPRAPRARAGRPSRSPASMPPAPPARAGSS